MMDNGFDNLKIEFKRSSIDNGVDVKVENDVLYDDRTIKVSYYINYNKGHMTFYKDYSDMEMGRNGLNEEQLNISKDERDMIIELIIKSTKKDK